MAGNSDGRVAPRNVFLGNPILVGRAATRGPSTLLAAPKEVPAAIGLATVFCCRNEFFSPRT